MLNILTFSLLINLLTFSFVSFGQKSAKQFGFGTGWYHHEFKDQAVATSVNKGSSIPILLFFRSNGEKNRHHLQFSFTPLKLESTYLLTQEKVICFQYAYHKKLTEINGFSFYGGGLIEMNAFFLKYSEKNNSYSYSFPFSTLESHGSLNPSILIEKSLSKQKFTVQGWFALFGYVFGGLVYERGWVGIGDFMNTGVRVSYSRYFSDHWEGRLDYQFQHYSLAKYENTSSSAHQVYFSMVYKFQ
jgi:hypothetical protein